MTWTFLFNSGLPSLDSSQKEREREIAHVHMWCMVGVQAHVTCVRASEVWKKPQMPSSSTIYISFKKNLSSIRLDSGNPAVSSSSLAWELQPHLGTTRHCYVDSGILLLARQVLLLNTFPAPLASCYLHLLIFLFFLDSAHFQTWAGSSHTMVLEVHRGNSELFSVRI